MKIMENFKSGFTAIVGRPNVGKSTLLNSLLGEKVAIITNKPQTTRNNIRGILNLPNAQIVFIDTPGIHSPKHKLGKNMVRLAESSVADGDISLFVISPIIAKADMEIAQKLSKAGGIKFLVINKIDTINKGDILPIVDAYKEICDFKEIIPISAIKGENLLDLKESIIKYLPKGPRYFPEGVLTDASDEFLIAEMIREKALYMLHEEIPHGIAVEVMSLNRRQDKPIIDINATLYCEKNSHKGMIIGKGGAMLKEISTRARMDIERIYYEKINLQLWVKVKENWRDSDFMIKSLGLNFKTDK